MATTPTKRNFEQAHASMLDPALKAIDNSYIPDEMEDDIEDRVAELEVQNQLLNNWATGLWPAVQALQKKLALIQTQAAETNIAGQDHSAKNNILEEIDFLSDETCDGDTPLTASYPVMKTLQAIASGAHAGELQIYGANTLTTANYYMPYLTVNTASTSTLAWAKLDETSLDLDVNGGFTKIELNKWRITTSTETSVSTDLFVVRPTGADPLPKYVSFQDVLDNGGGETAIITIGDGEWWQLGGDSTTCYGVSIGDSSNATPVIDLLAKQLGAGAHTPAHTDNWSVIAGYKFKVLDTTDNDGNVDVGAFQVTGGMSVKLKSYFGDNMKLASGKSFTVGADVLTIREITVVDTATGESINVKALTT